METKNITKGKWEAEHMESWGSDVCVEGTDICTTSSSDFPESECMANAELIAEVGNVANEIGLSPRQILEQRDELLRVLREITERKGAFNIEKLKWANNVIEAMSDLAEEAIKSCKNKTP